MYFLTVMFYVASPCDTFSGMNHSAVSLVDACVERARKNKDFL